MGWRQVFLPGGGGGGGTSGPNAVGRQRPALRVSSVIRVIGGQARAGLRVVMAPIRGTTRQAPALLLQGRASGRPWTVQTPSLRVLHTFVNLVRSVYASGQTTTSSVPAAVWTTPANALGPPDGTTAWYIDQNVANAQNGTLILTFDPPTGKEGMTIDKAEVRDWTQHAPGLTATDFSIKARIGTGGAWVNVIAPTRVAHNTRTTPRTTLIPTAVHSNSWANVANLQIGVFLTDTQALGAGTGRMDIDAIQLVITASRTEAPA